jgi:hypothetical protein
VVDGPIFVTADEPLLVFESLDRALGFLEWQDVDDGIYRGYDGDGRLIKFNTEAIARSRWRFFHDKRVVADIEPDPTHTDALRSNLARILDMPEATSLDELKNAAVSRFGLT